LDWLSTEYRKLGWRSKLSHTLKRIVWLSFEFIRDNGRVFDFAGDETSVRAYFEDWKRQHPDISPAAYPAGVSWLVRGLLGISELARVWPNITVADGDDPTPFAPFMIKALERADKGDMVSKGDLDHMEVAHIMSNWAVNLGKIVESDFTEREHFKLLVDDIARTFSDDEELDGAIDALERALKIAKDLGDHIYQIQVLSNLGVVHGQRGDREQSETILLEAGRIHNENYTGKAFPAVALSNGAGIEHRRTEAVSDEDKSRIIEHLDIPIRLASLFDRDPDEAVRQFRQLVRMVGNIEANLGHNALIADEFEKAEDRFKYALTNFSDLNDGPNIAMTLTNLATVAKRSGDNAKACDYWRQSLSVCKKLKAVHAGEVTELRWENAIQDLESVMETSGCGEK
jgi:tetratricopeptide (TPR) repeat protein